MSQDFRFDPSRSLTTLEQVSCATSLHATGNRPNRSKPWRANSLMELCKLWSYTLRGQSGLCPWRAGHAVLAMR